MFARNESKGELCGTAVRGISLVEDNPEQIEGRISGQQIVILAQFVKKSN